MAILEMIPPEYWRRLKNELSRLDLDKMPGTALPRRHPDGREAAVQFGEAISNFPIIGESVRNIVSAYKKRIQELEWVAEKRKERVGELEFLLEEEIRRRENIEDMLGKEVRENFRREKMLMREIANYNKSAPRKRGRGRPKGSRNKKNEVPTR